MQSYISTKNRMPAGGNAFPRGGASGPHRARRSPPPPFVWLVLLLSATALPLAAQQQMPPPAASDSDADIFAAGAFDKTVEMGTKAADKNKLVWLGGLTLVSETLLNVLPDDQNAGADEHLYGKAFLKASAGDLGQVYVSYIYDQLLLAGGTSASLRSYYDTYRGQAPNLSGPTLALSELHYSFDIDKTLFIRVGDQLLGWSASRIWTPADFVNQQEAIASAPLDVRVGKPGIRLHIPFTGANIFAFADFSNTVQSAVPGGSGTTTNVFETVNYAVRADATVGGFNIGIQGYTGWDAATHLGATFSGNLATIDLWGEFATQLPINGYIGTWAFSFGGERDFGDDKQWAIRAEYFHQSNGHDDTNLSSLPASSAITQLYWGKDYGWLEFSNTEVIGTVLGAALAGTVNFSDLSFQVKGTLNFNLPKLVPFSLAVYYNGGQSDREFTAIGTGTGTANTKPYWQGELTAILNL